MGREPGSPHSDNSGITDLRNNLLFRQGCKIFDFIKRSPFIFPVRLDNNRHLLES